jgi:fatty-acyl-CoA synthase
MKSMGRHINETVAKYPNKEALVFQNERITYRELGETSDKFAKGLLKLGVKKGDHVCIWMLNCPQWIYAHHGIFKLGATLVPTNTRFKTGELEYILRQSDSSTLIFKDTLLGKVSPVEMLAELIPEIEGSDPGKLESTRFPKLKNVICLGSRHKGMFSYDDILSMGNTPALDKELEKSINNTSADDIGYIMYTSGTTGFPKGAMLPQRNTMALIYYTAEQQEITEKSVILGGVPLFTNFGSNALQMKSVLYGSRFILMETWNAEEALRLIDREKVTFIEGIPTMILMMLEHPKLNDYNLKSLDVVTMGGAPIVPELVYKLKEIGVRYIFQCYGLVEAGGISMMSPKDATPQGITSSVGRTIPYCKVKIVDPSTGEELPVGKDGEICMADNTEPGCHVTRGYYNMAKETAETFVNGWVHSGDRGHMLPDGSLVLTGRIKDMILVGGFNVYPAEIESVLQTHPAVSFAAVTGIPDHRLGEVGMAFLRLKEGTSASESDIIEFCKSRLANMKVPRHVRFVQDFPMTPAGKIQKFKLREKAIEELGL